MAFYRTNHNPRDSHDILPVLRDLYPKYPEYRHHEAWELQWLLFVLGYSDESEGESKIASAAETARREVDTEGEDAA